MLRYCTYCKRDFDFAPLTVSGKDDLICPVCGNVIGKESRDPEKKEMTEQLNETIGRTFSYLLHLSYIFYLTMGIIGTAGFILSIDPVLYGATAVSLAVYIIQLLTGTLIFRSGLIFLPAGAIAGFLYFRTAEGACLGINIVFLIRHLIRDILFRLLFAFIRRIS